MSKRFWFVWNPQGRNPTQPHVDRASADKEAQRLARCNPGQAFIVLKSVGGFRADRPMVEKLPLTTCSNVAFRVDDEIPF